MTVGGKFTFKGKAPNLKFAETQEPSRVYQYNCKSLDQNSKFYKLISKYLNPQTTCNQVNEYLETVGEILDDFDLAIGNTAQAKTYDEGLSYPFRAESVKVVFAFTGNECEVGKFLPLQIFRTLLYRNNQIFLNLVTPLGNFRVKDPKTTKETVGFNSHNVFALGAAAKKKADAGAELHKDLEYVDFCSRFTVNVSFPLQKGKSRTVSNFVMVFPFFRMAVMFLSLITSYKLKVRSVNNSCKLLRTMWPIR